MDKQEAHREMERYQGWLRDEQEWEEQTYLQYLEGVHAAALEFVKNSYAPSAKYDRVRWLRLCQSLNYLSHDQYFDLLEEAQEEGLL